MYNKDKFLFNIWLLKIQILAHGKSLKENKYEAKLNFLKGRKKQTKESFHHMDISRKKKETVFVSCTSNHVIF